MVYALKQEVLIDANNILMGLNYHTYHDVLANAFKLKRKPELLVKDSDVGFAIIYSKKSGMLFAIRGIGDGRYTSLMSKLSFINSNAKKFTKDNLIDNKIFIKRLSHYGFGKYEINRIRKQLKNIGDDLSDTLDKLISSEDTRERMYDLLFSGDNNIEYVVPEAIVFLGVLPEITQDEYGSIVGNYMHVEKVLVYTGYTEVSEPSILNMLFLEDKGLLNDFPNLGLDKCHLYSRYCLEAFYLKDAIGYNFQSLQHYESKNNLWFDWVYWMYKDKTFPKMELPLIDVSIDLPHHQYK